MLSNKSKTALAVFVKTPELSSVKTRLGQSIGAKQAIQFYELSIKKIRSELDALKRSKLGDQVDIYWSLAESFTPLHALKWADHKRIHQQGESLGERIHSVYGALIELGYSKVILLGGDSPQLTHKDYSSWVETPLFNKEVSVGPAEDGGFYTFVSGSKIPQELWSSVNYSETSTTTELAEKLSNEGYMVNYLPETFDVDYKDDLDKLSESFSVNSNAEALKIKQFIDGLNF